MAVFKVKKGDTYESIAQRYGVSPGAVMRYLKGRPIHKGMTINTRVLAGMPQGGQAYAALSPDINPWGMPAGEVPDWAYETEAGTDIAENYLAAIGGYGYGVGGAGAGEGFGTDQRPPAAEAPQALTGAEQLAEQLTGVTSGGRTGRKGRMPYGPAAAAGPPTTETAAPVVEFPALGEPIDLAQLAGAGVGPQVTVPFYPGIGYGQETFDIPQALAPPQVSPAEYPPFYPGVGQVGPSPSLAPIDYPPFYPGVGWGPNPLTTPSMAPGGEYVIPTPSGESVQEEYDQPSFWAGFLSGRDPAGGAVTQPVAAGRGQRQPSHYGMRGQGIAALEVKQVINQGGAPTSMSPDVATYLGYSDKLMDDAGYVKNPETGLWELDMTGAEEEGGEGTGTGTSGGGYGGGYSRYRRGGRGGYGRRRTSYGSTFYNGQVNTHFNWRIRFN